MLVHLHLLRRRLAAAVALATGLLLVLPAASQATKPVAPDAWRPPTITLADPAAQAIALRAVDIATEVQGQQAQTRITLTLHNPNARVLEGELQFPLLAGQVVTGFALDVNGQLRDAVPVPKARGQEVFEDIRRRRVDPGLLEAVAGNQYKLRVYPLPAQGERRVQLTVTQPLDLHNGRPVLRLPLVFSSPVGALQVRVRAHGLQPRDVQLLQAPAGTAVEQDAHGTTLRLARTHWVAQGAAGLQLALHTSAPVQALVGESDGKRYFSAQLALRDAPVARPAPAHIALVWDASASGSAQGAALRLLDAYFRGLHDPVRVSLLVVRNRVEPVRSFRVAAGQWDALLQALRAEPFDGSSNFDELPVPADADTTLLVSDGLATDGHRLLGYRHSAPVFAISASAATDTPRLARLAERTGGAMIDLNAMGIPDAVRAMHTHGWQLERLHSLDAQHLVAPSLRVQGGRIAVAGELGDAKVAQVALHLRHPDGRRRVLPLRIDAPATAGRWPAQQWAQWRSAELAENPALHRTELQQIAARHGVVGPNSSLIVLELASDYARYELPAPPELAAEVDRLRSQQRAQAGQQRQAHIERMVRQFEERQAWWERSFPKDTPQPVAQATAKAQAGAAVGLAGRAREESARAAAAPAVAAPAPAPMMAAQRADAAPTARAPQPTIALQGWTPDAPYYRRLQDTPTPQLYRVYLDERANHTSSSAFFLDAAGLFFERGETALALRVLSNLAEMNLENRQLLRLYAYRLVQAGRSDLAVPVFERVRDLAPNEPQSWRDLGLALADSGQPQPAVAALWEVVSRPWPRFAGIPMIALAELNALAAQAEAADQPLDLSQVDARLRRNLPLGLRVVMAWDTDDTDIDLWVTDPNGEKSSYAQRLSYQGGAMSPDATGGYGPEEFALRHPKAGTYVVHAQFFGHRQQVLSAGTTVMVRVTTGFGTAARQDAWMTLRLTRGQETARVGEVRVP